MMVMHKTATENYIQQLEASGYYGDKIVTGSAINDFLVCRNLSPGLFRKNPDQPYCVAVVGKKVAKFEKLFSELVKPEYK